MLPAARPRDRPELGARKRLDTELVNRGLATNRTEASALVAAGHVLVGGAVATKASRQVARRTTGRVGATGTFC